MKNSKILGNKIKYLELDEDVDLEKFNKVEDELQNKVLPHFKEIKNLDLRFRKLGKHNTKTLIVNGLYSHSYKAVAIDPKDTRSTVHELAHSFDFANNQCKSLNEKFDNVLSNYCKNLGRTANNSYYSKPQEVFARGFEVAFNEKYGDLNHCAKTKEQMMKNEAYKPFYKNLEEVKEYFKDFI